MKLRSNKGKSYLMGSIAIGAEQVIAYHTFGNSFFIGLAASAYKSAEALHSCDPLIYWI